MKITFTKRRGPAEVRKMVEAWEARYGSLASLQQKIQISKCASPEMMGDYVLWKNLAGGAEFLDLVVLRDSDMFGTLSPRRAELLEYLLRNNVGSIRNLASALHRNYKNVYDDLLALAKYELVELIPEGRSLRPAAAASRINIALDE